MGHMRTAVLYHYCRSTDVKYYKYAVFLLAYTYTRKTKIITSPPQQGLADPELSADHTLRTTGIKDCHAILSY
jgi:hypothetical protein